VPVTYLGDEFAQEEGRRDGAGALAPHVLEVCVSLSPSLSLSLPLSLSLSLSPCLSPSDPAFLRFALDT
jgi:hypothetical protein